ncbi:MAG: hypothetical protein JXA33_27595 [Anaerolineae bacterium]|nr:hypothetical protein [Anaerolineae bacterium]
MIDFDKFNPNVLFTFEEYKAFIEDVKLLKFKHSLATSGRKFGEAERLNKLLIIDLPSLYRSKLPTYLLARCPICGGRVTEPIDTFSLSGIGWWISESRGFGWLGRARKHVTDVFRPLGGERFPEPSYKAECAHVRAVCYGVNLNGMIPDDIKPASRVIIGSEKPGVLAPFMEQAGSFAVIHTLPVGRLDDIKWQPRYTAYFITYCNANEHAYLKSLTPRDPYDRLEFFWPYELMDYDLETWIRAGKLFWLGPEAEEYPLQNKPVSGFPYANMDGLVGRWAAHRAKGAYLLPDIDAVQLDNPGHLSWNRVKAQEEKALRDRAFKRLVR